MWGRFISLEICFFERNKVKNRFEIALNYTTVHDYAMNYRLFFRLNYFDV